MFAQNKAGVQGAKPPAKERRCHPEGASADDFAPEGSRGAPIYKRAAVPLRSGLLCILRCTRFAHQNFTQIIRLRINGTNKIALLLPIDPFEGFFSCYCFVYVVVLFKVHELIHVIPCGIAIFVYFIFVFFISAGKVVCYTYIKNTVSFVCFNVNVICVFVHSDYIRLYNFVFGFTSDFFVQVSRRPRNNSVGTRSFGGRRSADAASG